MLPKHHILFGLIFIAVLFFLFPDISLLGLAIIFLSSILIDVDHMLYYFLREKNFNPLKAYSWYIERGKKICHLPREQKKNFYSGFYIFHGIEILILLFLSSNYIPLLFFVFVGFSFHFVLDIIHEIYDKATVDKSSLIWNFYRFRKLNASGAI
jgi:hypothetical protein